MKKTLPIILLSIFLFNVAGYYFAFKIEQIQIKEEMESEIKSGLNTADLTKITFSKTDLASIEWIEDNKEMRYNNALYDVVKSDETSTTLSFYCINDSKEQSLIADLENHINTHVIANNKTEKNSKKSTDNITKLYFSTKQNLGNVSTTFSHDYIPYHLIFNSTFLEINAPPPEFV